MSQTFHHHNALRPFDVVLPFSCHPKASAQFSDAVSTIENPAPELPEDVPEVDGRESQDA